MSDPYPEVLRFSRASFNITKRFLHQSMDTFNQLSLANVTEHFASWTQTGCQLTQRTNLQCEEMAVKLTPGIIPCDSVKENICIAMIHESYYILNVVNMPLKRAATSLYFFMLSCASADYEKQHRQPGEARVICFRSLFTVM